MKQLDLEKNIKETSIMFKGRENLDEESQTDVNVSKRKTNRMIVNVHALSLRTKPSDVANLVFNGSKPGVVLEGKSVEIIRKVNEDWFEVNTEGFGRGFMMSKHLMEA